jgi:hypothetical protein
MVFNLNDTRTVKEKIESLEELELTVSLSFFSFPTKIYVKVALNIIEIGARPDQRECL